MKRFRIVMVLLVCGLLVACNTSEETNNQNTQDNTGDLSYQEQAELVAAALSQDNGGLEDDIDKAARAAAGEDQRQAQARSASLSLEISINVDFYDEEDNLQEAYDRYTTNSIDYDALIKGRLNNPNGYFQELIIDRSAQFFVDNLLSRTALVDGTHINHFEFSRVTAISQAQIHYEMTSELTVEAVTVDLDADDTFPESGTIEGDLSGSYERTGTWQVTRQFNFHFIATYLGNNTARIELSDGRVFIVQLETGTLESVD